MTKNQVLVAISLIVAVMSSLSTLLYLSNNDLRHEIARRDTVIDGLLSQNLKMSAEIADLESRLIVAGIHPTKKLRMFQWRYNGWQGITPKDDQATPATKWFPSSTSFDPSYAGRPNVAWVEHKEAK
jgi:hypothetical protein